MPNLSVNVRIIVLLCSALLCGCTTTSPDVIRPEEAGQLQAVSTAVVEGVRLVRIEGRQSGVGALAGAVVGGVAGGGVGGRRENIAGGVLGGVLGAVVGNAIEKGGTAERAVELTLRRPNGLRQVVVQAQGSEVFSVGDSVQIVEAGGRVRVARIGR